MVAELIDALSTTAATNVLILLLAGLSAVAAVVLAVRARRAPAPHGVTQRGSGQDTAPPTFLFEDRILVDATPAGHRILHSVPGPGGDWIRLNQILCPRFPRLSDSIARAPEPGDYLADIPGDDSRLEIDRWGNMTRFTIRSDRSDRRTLHPEAVQAMEHEIETLRGIGEQAPLLIWLEDSRGVITWANRAYMRAADQFAGTADAADATWPPARLFADTPHQGQDGRAARIAVEMPGANDKRWFEVQSCERGAGTLNFATDIGAVVTAESQNRQFMQTITKTFAQLSIGLAIFDRKRRLVIFNPALLDLTRLPIEFLSAQPSIRAFLDRLRDDTMIPEPSNYRTWREEVAALEVAAERGSYRESWALPTGQTYRVTGRPHPDGAIALTFEDVTAAISLSRSFRSEIEIAKGVLDTLDEAIAVFSPGGTLWMSNAAYDATWGHSAEGLEDVEFRDAVELWQSHCAPGPIWSEARRFATTLGDRSLIEGQLRRKDGRALSCRFQPLPGGASLVGFASLAEAGHAMEPPQSRRLGARAQMA